jgi:hypothetical protein
MDRASGSLNIAVLCEYPGYITVRPTAAPKLRDELAVRLQARARWSFLQGIEDCLKLVVHELLEDGAESYATGTGQLPD